MAGPRPVLIVEDDAALAATLTDQLVLDAEFEPVVVGRLLEAEALLATPGVHFDLVLLDLSLPDGDGREFCIRARRGGFRMPIIMLTGSDGEADIVSGLDAGANDYIAKPFRLAELLARIRVQLRVYDSSEDAIFQRLR